jgi:hypothetical protein
LEPLHHCLSGILHSSGCGGNEGWGVHEAAPGNEVCKEYLHAFNNLARYALEFVNTEAKKIASFQRGLSSKMLKTMGTGTRAIFNAYISDCLTQENNNNNYSASKSHKRAFEAASSQSRAPVAGHQ